MEISWHSYPSIYALGHKVLVQAGFLDQSVLVEEKVDGSQFSFGEFPGDEPGELNLRCRSKGAELHLVAPEKMFQRAIEEVQARRELLHPGWTYRTEYLMKPKHNTLAYDRHPKGHLIVFDVNDGLESYLTWEAKAREAERLGLECVPRLHAGKVEDVQVFRDLLQTPSVLGGQPVEGIVVKRYDLFGPDKRALMGKYVSEAFKEVHHKAWRDANPKSGDILDRLGETYTTPARWQKAVQHLAEAGRLEGSPRDIGLLIKEVWPDILGEEREEIAGRLWAWAEPHLRRRVTRGLPEWYKQRLLDQALVREAEK